MGIHPKVDYRYCRSASLLLKLFEKHASSDCAKLAAVHALGISKLLICSTVLSSSCISESYASLASSLKESSSVDDASRL